jgi:hypothetical protein
MRFDIFMADDAMAKVSAMIGWNLAASNNTDRDPLTPLRMMTPYYIAPIRQQPAVREEPLPGDLPEYIVYVTRNALLSVTSSLTKVFGDTHEALARINHMLAFERFMRAAVAWHTPILPAAFSPFQLWQPPAPKQQMVPLLAYWGAPSLPALPKPEIYKKASKPAQTEPMPQMPPAMAAMMAVPMAFLTLAPMVMDAWRLAL